MKDFAKIEEIYHTALELAPAERVEFLKNSCGNDELLRREIESLISSYESAGNFIESPPQDFAADLLVNHAHENPVGKEFGHYKILSQIGMGGMGEVYLAEDIKLGRKIALKILPPQFSQESERQIRFEQEARAISALNHPNIITIHGIEQTEEFNFIATEFIEGQTLREKIQQGKLGWQETVKIGIQIVSALESAHSVGIIHRDIKPANIMIRRDGIVKVLDFGLAKLVESQESRVESLESGVEDNQVVQELKTHFSKSQITSPNSQLTNAGTILGTLHYMSPEQALGEALDGRTDIFSLGVVMYEMLSGVQPFAGVSDEAVYNATINTNPPSLSELNNDIPLELDQIIKKALEKNRENRCQNATEMRNDLQKLRENSFSSSGQMNSFAGGKTRRKSNLFLPIAAAFGAIILSLGAYYFYTGKSGNDSTANPTFSYTQLTDQNGEELFPSFSPDGKTLIYASKAAGNWDIYEQRVGGKNPQNLTKNSTTDDTQPVFSPDGERIAFRSERDGGGIFVMGAKGENPKRIADFGFNPSWSPDGKEIAVSEEGIQTYGSRTTGKSRMWAINVENEQKRLVADFDTVQPAWSPNGKFIAYWTANGGGQRDIGIVPAGGGEAVQITNDAPVDWNPVWSPDGKYLYFASNRGGNMNLWRLAVNQETGKVLGVVEAVTIPTSHGQHFAFTTDGKNFGYVQNDDRDTIQHIGFDAVGEKVVGNPKGLIESKQTALHPTISPDGEWIAFSSAGDRKEDLFIVKKDGSGLRQLTDDMAKDRLPRWSPDGNKIAFYSDRSGIYEIWTVNPDGSELKVIAGQPGITHRYPFWSPDGKRMAFIFGDLGTHIFDLETPYSEQTAVEVPQLENASVFEVWSWSPDGKYLAGNARNSAGKLGEMLLYSPETRQFSKISDKGTNPVWLNDNRRILFNFNGKIYLMDIQTGRTRQILALTAGELGLFELSRDNRTIYFGIEMQESDIWMAHSQE